MSALTRLNDLAGCHVNRAEHVASIHWLIITTVTKEDATWMPKIGFQFPIQFVSHCVTLSMHYRSHR